MPPTPDGCKQNRWGCWEKGMKGTLGDYKIISVAETPLMDVFRHKVEE